MVVEIFNDYFAANIVKNRVSRETITLKDSVVIQNRIKNFVSYSSIKKMKDWMHSNMRFSFDNVSTEEVDQEIRNLNERKGG